MTVPLPMFYRAAGSIAFHKAGVAAPIKRADRSTFFKLCTWET